MSFVDLTDLAPSVIYIQTRLQAAMVSGDPHERLEFLMDAVDMFETVLAVVEKEADSDDGGE